MSEVPVKSCATDGDNITRTDEGGWRLSIPGGAAGKYRVAQLDDYQGRSRGHFPWHGCYELRLRGRASAAGLPGTSGFGLWNDPFSMNLLSGGGLRFPALPNAAWFFFASPENYLSLHNHQPANGALAGVFRSPPWPGLWMAAGAPALPLIAWPPTARLLRRLGRGFVRHTHTALTLDPTAWHTYHLRVEPGQTVFQIDGETVLETPLAPRGRVGLVLWIDNQYMALPPDGRARYGWLENPPAWIEVVPGWEHGFVRQN